MVDYIYSRIVPMPTPQRDDQFLRPIAGDKTELHHANAESRSVDRMSSSRRRLQLRCALCFSGAANTKLKQSTQMQHSKRMMNLQIMCFEMEIL